MSLPFLFKCMQLWLWTALLELLVLYPKVPGKLCFHSHLIPGCVKFLYWCFNCSPTFKNCIVQSPCICLVSIGFYLYSIAIWSKINHFDFGINQDLLYGLKYDILYRKFHGLLQILCRCPLYLFDCCKSVISLLIFFWGGGMNWTVQMTNEYMKNCLVYLDSSEM